MIEYRSPTPDEYRQVSATVNNALLNGPPDDELWNRVKAGWEDRDTVAAWQDGKCVGSAAAYRFETIVPGGSLLRTAGVTSVGIKTTARRQGIARELMTRVLRDARERGQVLASLRASEATIYGRFGFGIAGDFEYIVVDPRMARPIAGKPFGSMRLLERDDVYDTIETLYPRVAMRRPGVITRPRFLIERYFRDAVEGPKSEHVAVHTDDNGNDDGFVHYGVAWTDAPATMLESGRGEIYDLWGATPNVERELWRYICSVDLIESWHIEERPPDDAVRTVVANPRSVTTPLHIDEQWLRLLDVGVALTTRSYNPIETPLTIEVSDPLFDANCGRWTIASGIAHRDDDATPTLRADIATLSAAYLGGTGWWQLAVADRVTDAAGALPDVKALTLADAVFAVRPLPFCGSFF